MTWFEKSGKSFVIRPEGGQLEVYYGLPPEVKFCTSCVISNQRPSSTIEFRHRPDAKKTTMGFDDAGVCGALIRKNFSTLPIDFARRTCGKKQTMVGSSGTR